MVQSTCCYGTSEHCKFEAVGIRYESNDLFSFISVLLGGFMSLQDLSQYSDRELVFLASAFLRDSMLSEGVAEEDLPSVDLEQSSCKGQRYERIITLADDSQEPIAMFSETDQGFKRIASRV
jgi:hypothetical protein